MLAYVSLVPFWIAGTILFVLLVAAVAYQSKSRVAIAIASLVFMTAAGFWAAFPFVTGAKRIVTHDMQWSYREPAAEYPGADHILLTFADYPGHHIGIYSKDLADYLERLPSNDVQVTFEVVLDFGSTRGFSELQIGELRQWDSQFSYAGSDGSSASPWP
jgi:hypothetical protein